MATALAAIPLLGLAGLGMYAAPCSALNVYGAANSAGGPSDFYYIYPAGFGTQLIGPIGFDHVGAMDIHPTTGVIYACGVRSGDATPVLISINRATGEGTEIGPSGLVPQIGDLAFRPSDGVLFAHDVIQHRLYTIDTATGASTLLGPTGVPGQGNAIEFSPDGVLYLYTNASVYTLDQTNGAATFVGAANYGLVGFVRPPAMDQLPGGQFILLIKDGTNNVSKLATVYAGSGAVSVNLDSGPYEMEALVYDPHLSAYATLPSGGTASEFYSLDVLTGATTLIGPIGFDHVGALDQDPIGFGETIYATGQRPGTGVPVLITIDPTTGDGTEVGPTGVSGFISDISRHESGVLYAYNAQNDPLHTLYALDIQTGAAQLLGDPGHGFTGGNGIAAVPAAPGGALYHASSTLFTSLNLFNGFATVLASPPTYVAPLGDPGFARPTAMDFQWGGTLFGLVKDGLGGAGTTRVAWGDYTTQTFREVSNTGSGSFDGLVMRESVSPQAQLLTPNGGEGFVSSTTQEVHWNTFGDHTIVAVDLALSIGVTLYASGDGNLYTLDPATAAATLVGPIGADRVGSIVAHPGKQLLYSSSDFFGLPTLIEINPETGHGTPIDNTGVPSSISDLAFRPSDLELFGYDASNNPTHSLRTFDINSGAGKLVALSNLGGNAGNGIAFSSGGVLYHSNALSLNTIDPATAIATQVASISYPGGLNFPRAAALDFHPGTGVLWALVKTNAGEALLGTIDIVTGVVTIIGDTGVGALDGMAWAPGPFTTFAAGEPNDGLGYWTVPFVATDLARIRVTMHDQVGNVARDISNRYFSILGPTSTPGATPVATAFLAPLAPNPFSVEAAIRFRVAQPSNVRLTVHDARGRLAKTLLSGTQEAGERIVRWDGRDESGAGLAAGIYVVRLEVNGEVFTRRGALLR
jgi:hypothetical protein